MITFLIHKREPRCAFVIVQAQDREHAKRLAHARLHGDPDHYVVTPLTPKNAEIFFLLG